MEVLVCKAELIELAFIILTVLNACPLILKADIELADIVDKLRVDSIDLVDIREAVCAEIYIRLGKRTGCSLSKTEILHITQHKHSLPFLSIDQRKPRR
jgi:hypothetical protein